MVPFRLIETLPDSFFAAAASVIDGGCIGAICRSYIPNQVCDETLRRFLSDPHLKNRSGDAKGQYLGTFHWRKSQSEYLAECLQISSAVASFSPEWNDGIRRLDAALSIVGTRARPADWDQVQVATPLVRNWEGGEDFALIPHEDASQCTDPIQKGFEIQSVANRHRVCSLNLCIANSAGGELQLWDHVPSVDEKEEFGTSIEGGPYPLQFTKTFETMIVPIRPGDIYIFNGMYLHAVRAASSHRATISCLIGRVSDREVIMWT